MSVTYIYIYFWYKKYVHTIVIYIIGCALRQPMRILNERELYWSGLYQRATNTYITSGCLMLFTYYCIHNIYILFVVCRKIYICVNCVCMDKHTQHNNHNNTILVFYLLTSLLFFYVHFLDVICWRTSTRSLNDEVCISYDERFSNTTCACVCVCVWWNKCSIANENVTWEICLFSFFDQWILYKWKNLSDIQINNNPEYKNKTIKNSLSNCQQNKQY